MTSQGCLSSSRERENDFCICFFSVGLKFWFVCQRLKILNNWISQSELNFHSFFPVIHLKSFPSLFLLLHDIPTHIIYHCNLFFKFFKNNKISRVLDLIIFNLHLFIDSNLINERIYWFIISTKRNNLWIPKTSFKNHNHNLPCQENYHFHADHNHKMLWHRLALILLCRLIRN